MSSDERSQHDPVQEMRRHFLVPFDSDDAFGTLHLAAGQLPPEHVEIAAAFRQNLNAVLTTASMPFSLASTGVHARHFERVGIAERIRARSIEAVPADAGLSLEDFRDREAHRRARDRFQELLASSEGQEVVIQDICNFLLTGLGRGLAVAAQELLHQSLVLLWSAFEVLFRDTFQLHLNRHPKLITQLVDDPATRRRLEAERFGLDILAEYDSDLSHHLGTVLVARQDFSDLTTVKTVFGTLFPRGTRLRNALADPVLWVLSQRRHLIVHRRGIVDRAYLQSTSESDAIGSRLAIEPASLETGMEKVAQSAEALFECLTQSAQSA